MPRLTYIILILLAFAAVGALTGFLVGASHTPVVASFLPLLFAVFGAIGYSAIEKRLSSSPVPAQQVAAAPAQQVGIPPSSINVPVTPTAPETNSLAAPALWSAGITLLCIAGLAGIHSGMESKAPQYPPLTSWIKLDGFTQPQAALLFSIRWKMQSIGLAEPEAREFFRQTIPPVLAEKDQAKRMNTLIDILNNTQPAAKGRVIANEDPPIPRPPGNFPS